MTVVDLYTIQIVRGESLYKALLPAKVDEIMAEAEENLTDLLPDGYRARIRRWDHPDPDEHEHQWEMDTKGQWKCSDCGKLYTDHVREGNPDE